MNALNISPIGWDPSYDSEIKEIDEQHRNVLKALNEYGEILKSPSIQQIGPAAEFLVKTIMVHFKSEECLLSQTNYKHSSLHATSQQSFMARLNKSTDKLLRGDNDGYDLYQLVRDWLFSHIRSDDSVMVIKPVQEFRLAALAAKKAAARKKKHRKPTLSERLLAIGNKKIF